MPDSPLPPWVEGPPDADLILNTVENFDDPAPDSLAGGWQITSDGEAEWAMAHLAAATAQRDAHLDQVKLWQAKLDEFRVAGLAAPDRAIAFFGERLERYGRVRRELNPDVPTIRLASGDIKTTLPSAPSIVLVDDDAFIAWARNALVPDGVDDPAEPLPHFRTYAELGCVKTKHEAMISVIRRVLSVWVCEGCSGQGQVPEHDGPEAAGAPCGDCQGAGVFVSANVVGIDGSTVAQRVPGLGVELPSVSAKPAPRPLGLMAFGGAR